MPIRNFRCQICGADALNEIPLFREFSRVTSDCRPFEKGGQITVCACCGGVQKLPTQAWYEEISRIYANYEAYYQADGKEQIVFDPVRGFPRPRSEVFLDRLQSAGILDNVKSILDVGCGTGMTLRAIQKMVPGVELNGYELTDQNAGKLFKIYGFKELFVGGLEKISRKFDFVSMVHSLEHFTLPLKVLSLLKERLNPDGILFVEVCNAKSNPFDLLIADHLMHFSAQTLSDLLERAGYNVMLAATEWINKELSVVAKSAQHVFCGARNQLTKQVDRQVLQSLDWLHQLANVARSHAQDTKPFGVFGTSISATWIAAEVGSNLEFFVDEDEGRVGRPYLGKPVLHPGDVPVNSYVFLALIPEVARVISARLAHLPINFILPPAYELAESST